MELAREPVLRNGKADGLVLSKLFGERVPPYLPELMVISAVVKEPGAFVNVRRTNIAPEYVPQCVQGGVQHKISGSQGLKRDLLACSSNESRKKRLFQVARPEAFRMSIPTPKVEFQGERNVRVEVVSPPDPTGLADQGRKMIHDRLRAACDARFKAETCDNCGR
jgi:hypothetical protein